MRKPYRYSFLIMVIFAAALVLLAETLIVKVKSTYLRKEPMFFAQTVTSLKAGEKLEKISSQGGWIKVKTSRGLVGWIHSGSVQPKKFSLLAMDKSLKTEATADEVALAAKGFNKQVEESYRAKNKNISYAWVEKMLQIKVSYSQIRDFIKTGKLGEFGGQK